MRLTRASLRSTRLPLLHQSIEDYNQHAQQKWGVFLLKEYDANPTGEAIMVAEILLVTDMTPPEGEDLCIISTEEIPDLHFCVECARLGILTRLGNSNRSGYCAKHSNKVPSRRAMINSKRKSEPNSVAVDG